MTNKEKFDFARMVSIRSIIEALGQSVPARRANGKVMMKAWWRGDTNASLQIDENLNRYSDFGSDDKNYRSNIDLVMEVLRVNAMEAVDFILKGSCSTLSLHGLPSVKPNEKGIEIERIQPITDERLRSYMMDVRGIPDTIYMKYCKQVKARIKGSNKVFWYVGFKNNKGDYELRNGMRLHNKRSTGKDITTIKNGKTRIAVFEGFIDFLTYKIWHEANDFDYLILNSTSNYRKCVELVKEYSLVHCYLDNDPTGRTTTAEIIALVGARCSRDMASIYEGYNDYNDWHRAQLLKNGGAQRYE